MSLLNRKWVKIPLILLATGWLVVFFGNDVIRLFENNQPSKSSGTYANGKLTNGKRLPNSGANFRTYSRIGSLIGRNSAHHAVCKTILEAYDQLNTSAPDKYFIYGETGWPGGGPFPPHHTHQNGLSVDFMTPLLDGDRSVELPTSLLNRFGYDVDFDSKGNYQDLTIDFQAIALHLAALRTAASKNGLRIKRVFFDPRLQPLLFATKEGAALRRKIQFNSRQAWWRHDEHYHVDFEIITGS